MIVVSPDSVSTSRKQSHQSTALYSSSESPASGVFALAPAPVSVPRQVSVSHQAAPTASQLDFALEGRSISLQQRSSSTAKEPQRPRTFPDKTFLPLQLRIDLQVPSLEQASPGQGQTKGQSSQNSRRLRAQARRRQEQQRPTEEVVFKRRTRPKTSSTCRTPLTMSTMSLPAAGQKFSVADDAIVFNTAEEASAVVKRLLAKSKVIEEHHVSTSTKKVSQKLSSESMNNSGRVVSEASPEYLQDSYDQLHQRHIKNLSDVIARHQRQTSQEEQRQQKAKKQVHIHQSAFYDGQDDQNSQVSKNSTQTYTSTKSINLNNRDRASSGDLVRGDSSSSSVPSSRSSECSDTGAVVSHNKSNKSEMRRSSSSSSSSSTSSVQQSFNTKQQVFKQSFSSSSQDFEDRIGIDVTLTPSPTTMFDRIDDDCVHKQTVKTFTTKSVKKSVSDGNKVKTDVEEFTEKAEEHAEGRGGKPVITFSHVSSEGSQQHLENDIVRFDSSTLSSPARSRSPSPLLEMPPPYSDLSKEIRRPPNATSVRPSS